MARHARMGPAMSILIQPDGRRWWRIYVPTFGPDLRPIPGKRKEHRLLVDEWSKADAEREMQRLYRAALAAGADGPAGPRAPGLVESLMRYHREQTCGPAPRRPKTQDAEWAAIRDVACWLADRAAGLEKTPRKPGEIVAPGADPALVAQGVDIPLDTFGLPEVDALRSYLARRMGATSVNLRLRHLRGPLAWMVERDMLQKQPIKAAGFLPVGTATAGATTPPAPSRKRHYTLPEVAKLDESLAGEVQRFGRLLFLTGARAGQVGALAPADILLEEGLLRIPAGKTDSYTVPLFPALVAVLEGWSGWAWRHEWAYRAVKAAGQALGIQVAQPLHAYRHGLTTALSEAGVPWEDICRWQGRSLGRAGSIAAYDHGRAAALARVAQAIPVPWFSENSA